MDFIKINAYRLLRADAVDMVQLIDSTKVKIWLHSGANFEFNGSEALVITKYFFGENNVETKIQRSIDSEG